MEPRGEVDEGGESLPLFNDASTSLTPISLIFISSIADRALLSDCSLS